MKFLLEKFDTILNTLPVKVKKIISFVALGIWFFGAIIVVSYAFKKGKENAPIIGEDYFLNDVKDKIQKNQNLKTKTSIILPDLNDLIKQEIPLKIESIQETYKKQEIDIDTKKKLEILTEKDELLFYQNKKDTISLEQNIQNIKDKSIENIQENKKNKTVKLEPLPLEH